MRDPKRLEPNYKKLAQLHSKFPDMRMSQFLFNVFSEFTYDPFFLEDEEFLKEVERVIGSWSGAVKTS